MGKGSNTSTTTTSNQPPQQYLDAYSSVMSQAENVASTPLSSYPGSPYSMVAGFSPDQLQAMGMIEGNTGTADPYLNAASQYMSNAGAPLKTQDFSNYLTQAAGPNVSNAAQQGAGGIMNAAQSGQAGVWGAGGAGTNAIMNASQAYQPNQLGQWMSPYTQQVVNATQAQFNNQNQQQANQLRGNAASQGALGSDRLGIAQAQLANQQQLAQAPTIANLYQAGYTNAEQQALAQAQMGLQGATAAGQLGLGAATTAGQMGLTGAQQAGAMGLQGATTQAQLQSNAAQQLLGANEAQGWLNSQLGYGMANLGQEAFNITNTAASNLWGAGAEQQSLAQQYLNIPYEEWTAQQAYPFQTTSWLANIAEGLGSNAGGTATGSSSQSGSGSIGSEVAGLGTAALGTYGFGKSQGWWGNNSSSGSGDYSGYVDPYTNTSYSPSGAGLSGYSDYSIAPSGARGGSMPALVRRVSGGSIMSGNPVDAISSVSVPSSGMSNIPDPSQSIVPQGTSPNASGKQMNILQDYGSTSTSSGGASTGSQVESGIKTAAGIGAAAAGIAGASSSTVGALALLAAIKRGGRVKRPRLGEIGLAAGGVPVVTVLPSQYQGGVGVPQISRTGISGSSGSSGGSGSFNDYLNSVLGQIPKSTTTAASSSSAAAAAPAATATGGDSGSNTFLTSATAGGGSEAGGSAGQGGGSMGSNDVGAAGGLGEGVGNAGFDSGGGGSSADTGGGSAGGDNWRRGGRLWRLGQGGLVMRGFAEGGGATDDDSTDQPMQPPTPPQRPSAISSKPIGATITVPSWLRRDQPASTATPASTTGGNQPIPVKPESGSSSLPSWFTTPVAQQLPHLASEAIQKDIDQRARMRAQAAQTGGNPAETSFTPPPGPPSPPGRPQLGDSGLVSGQPTISGQEPPAADTEAEARHAALGDVAPGLTLPDTGGGGGDGKPPAPPTTKASTTGGGGGPGGGGGGKGGEGGGGAGGKGDTSIPPSPLPPEHQDAQALGDRMSETRDALKKHSDGRGWETLMAMGFGMMAGKSRYPLENIGAGALQGLEFGEKMRQTDEAQAQRLQQQQETNDIRRQQLGINQQRANTYGAVAQARANAMQYKLEHPNVTTAQLQQQAQNDLMGQINPDTGQKYTPSEAYERIHAIDWKWASLGETARHHGVTEGQGQQRNDQNEERIRNTEAYRQQLIALRSQGLDDATANNIMTNATRAVAADVTGKLTLEEAVRQQRAARGGGGGQGGGGQGGGGQGGGGQGQGSDAQSIDNARKAIAAGRNRDQVIQKLKEAGITPPSDL